MKTRITSVGMLKRLCGMADHDMVCVFIQHGDKQEFFDVSHTVIEGLEWDNWTVFVNSDNSYKQYTSDEAFSISERRIMSAIAEGKLFINGEVNVTCDISEGADQQSDLITTGV